MKPNLNPSQSFSLNSLNSLKVLNSPPLGKSCVRACILWYSCSTYYAHKVILCDMKTHVLGLFYNFPFCFSVFATLFLWRYLQRVSVTFFVCPSVRFSFVTVSSLSFYCSSEHLWSTFHFVLIFFVPVELILVNSKINSA